MEVFWASFVMILCSCAAADDTKNGNGSIIEDFYSLNRATQLEICGMIKEPNASAQFTSQEQRQVQKDFCDQLEMMENQQADKNLLSRGSAELESAFSDQITSSESTHVSGVVGEESTTSGLSKGVISDLRSSTELAQNVGGMLQYSSLESSSSPGELIGVKSGIAAMSSSSNGTVAENITFLTGAEVFNASDWQDHSSSESSGNLSRREVIPNSNTPMVPDPTYADQEFDAINSLERFSLSDHSSESSSIENYSSEIDQLLNTSQNEKFSCSCNGSKIIEESSGNGDRKSALNANHKKCSICPEKKLIAAENITGSLNSESRISQKLEAIDTNEFSKNILKESNNSIKDTKCIECSTTVFTSSPLGLPQSTASPFEEPSLKIPGKNPPQLLKSKAYPKKYAPSQPTGSSAPIKNSSKPWKTTPYFKKLNAGPTHLNESVSEIPNIAKSISKESLLLPDKLKDSLFRLDSYEEDSTKKYGKTTNDFTSEYHVLPPGKNLESAPHVVTPICRFPVSNASKDLSQNSSGLKYCSSESKKDDSSASSTSTEDFEPFYAVPEPITADATHSIIKYVTKKDRKASSSSPYRARSTESTPHFCGSPPKPGNRPYNQTSRPALSPKSLCCNPRKLIVNPNSPRKSRRRTKILSSPGKLHSYAGFFEVDERAKTRLFFWFFCNENWKRAPLIVWLQGEPGLSSLHGLFEEHGPYFVERTKDGLIDLKLRKYAWTKKYNVLYLDHCVGCGFSSSEDYRAYDPSYWPVARNVYEALSQFYKVWYELVPNDLYLAGSYGGAKYIPVIAQTIHEANRNAFCSQKMNLKGLMIGGPYADAGAMVNYNDFLLANGIIDEYSHKDMIQPQFQAQELIRAGRYEDAIDFLNQHVYCLMNQAGYESYRDVRYLKKAKEENMLGIVQSEKFARMICTDNLKFKEKSEILIEEIMPSVGSLVPGLLENYKILYYNGQFDMMAPFMLTSKALLELEWQSIDQFYSRELIKWSPKQDTSKNSCVEGYYRTFQNLTHVMVRSSGHFVGTTNSRSLYYLLKWFVEDRFQRYYDGDNWYK